MTTYVLQTTLSHNLVYQVCAQARVVTYGQALISIVIKVCIFRSMSKDSETFQYQLVFQK